MSTRVQFRRPTPPRRPRALLLLALLALAPAAPPAPAALPACATNHPVLFVVRKQYRADHHNTATFFPSAPNEYNDGAFEGGGALKRIDLATGAVVTLLETATGVIRDPDVHFSGERILFSMRRNLQDSYHLYEINADGSGLRQLTSIVDADDLDPIYLPGDRIVFSSTREPKYVMCNRHISANLYAMDADGANVNQIGKSTLFEGHASLLPDGRVLYDRWEYVDRNFGDAQGLWVCNPNGTGHAVLWGNNTSSPGAVLDGRAIPGTPHLVCTFSSCHDRPWGAIAVLDRRLGVDGPDAVVRTWPAGLQSWVWTRNVVDASYDQFKNCTPKYEDPFPLADPATGVGGRYVLCSRGTGSGEQMGLYLLDTAGADTLLHAEGAGATGCYDPMPLAPRPRPLDVAANRGYDGGDGLFYVNDVYEGTHMSGVARGTVKFLRVVESPEKRQFTRSTVWGGQGSEFPAMNWHDFLNKRILGAVPVEEDGSAHFRCPSGRFVYFQLLDADGLLVQSMRSGTIVQPAENQGCVGCHESRAIAPPAVVAMPAAFRRPASTLGGWYGVPREFGYLTEVQPVFDAYCVSCHDFGSASNGGLVLAGDKDLFFNASYTELWRKKLVGAIGAGPAAIQQAKAWGSHASRLVQVLRAGHKDVVLPAEAFARVATWVDLNGPYYPYYASAYPGNLAGRSPLTDAQIARLGQLTGKSFGGMATCTSNPGPQVSFDRPEVSPCLAGLTGAAYTEALAIVRAGAAALAARPRADMPNFALDGTDAWREAKYAQRQAAAAMGAAACAGGGKVYDGDPLLAIVNRPPAGIDGAAARLSGQLLYTLSNQTAAVTVHWGLSDGGTNPAAWLHTVPAGALSVGAFAVRVDGLPPGVPLYYRCRAVNAQGEVWAHATTRFDTRSLIDGDGDGMADLWETTYFGASDSAEGAAAADGDHDGLTNLDEYQAGTNPTNAASVLALTALVALPDGLRLAWSSASNALYALSAKTNLSDALWHRLVSALPATPPTNVHTVLTDRTTFRYYRVEAHRPDR